MKYLLNNLEDVFNLFRAKAMDDNCSFDELEYNIVKFLNAANYQRTPYAMKFDGFYRARTEGFNSIEEACKEYGHEVKLGHPPASKAKDCRCNLKGEPVFYCAIDNATAIFEVRPQADQFLVLTCFIPRNTKKFEIDLPVIGVRKIRNVFAEREPENMMSKMLSDDIIFRTEERLVIELDKHLSELFIAPINEDNKYLYKLSTAYYKALTKHAKIGNDSIMGLIYPSVESDCTGYNIALETEASRNLKIHNAIIYKVEWKEKDGKTLRLRPIKQVERINSDGSINWKQAIESYKIWHLHPSDPSVSNGFVA